MCHILPEQRGVVNMIRLKVNIIALLGFQCFSSIALVETVGCERARGVVITMRADVLRINFLNPVNLFSQTQALQGFWINNNYTEILLRIINVVHFVQDDRMSTYTQTH